MPRVWLVVFLCKKWELFRFTHAHTTWQKDEKKVVELAKKDSNRSAEKGFNVNAKKRSEVCAQYVHVGNAYANYNSNRANL